MLVSLKEFMNMNFYERGNYVERYGVPLYRVIEPGLRYELWGCPLFLIERVYNRKTEELLNERNFTGARYLDRYLTFQLDPKEFIPRFPRG